MQAFNSNQVQNLWQQLQSRPKLWRTLAIWLLSLYLVAYAAELTWRLLPEPADKAMDTVAVHAGGNAKQPSQNIGAIKRLHLFGRPGQQPQAARQQVEEAPETRLNLALTGVVASNEENQGAAIIESSGKQKTYGVGEKIDRTSVILHQVYPDRVILKNGSQFETLMLEGLDYSKNPQISVLAEDNTPSSSSDDGAGEEAESRTLSDEALATTQALQQQPANFTDYIAITQHRRDGELAGYRVSPGKDPALFEAAGLKANDVITEINGLSLTDTEQAMQAMQELRNTQSLQLTIERDGSLLTLYLDLPSA
ncbi:Type II secretion system protein [Saliniradius amylolyticus]|uniref:Type II secretion system protein n=1 Tax=Saliniradius amylolyticus TaxID=2183582 RepID=A0A2S2E027_9ALTE|nr:type II secretion system protein GspC [Saliniradius amylolyticus]AWL10630.1 Type II secretion system protein [Saliniradius amylolyticus]